MDIRFDKEADAIYLRFSDAKVFLSDEEKPGIIIDYDQQGGVVGIELLDASKRTENPSKINYEVG
ncbi:MAG: DUF2283 domain-containing protein [Balneolaceae bacterium]